MIFPDALFRFTCLALAFAAVPRAQLCPVWSDGETIGMLDDRMLPEASGLAVSSDGKRLYHVNDSGGGPFLYVSGLSGGGVRRVKLEGVALQDSEALTALRLNGEPSVVVGDIGDNQLRRTTVDLYAFRERDLDADAAPASGHVRARYPDGPHNAEALAAGPDGSIYVFTKSWAENLRGSAPTRIYRLTYEAWADSSVATFEPVGEIDLPAVATRERAPFSDVVTDASMSQDGSRFLLLTYGYAWEFAVDLASPFIPAFAALERGRDYQLIRLKTILGKETIAYMPGDRAFLFGKEFKPDSKPSELVRIDCRPAP